MNFKTLLNFRDLGGVPAMDNKKLRRGLIFRSANPDNLSMRDISRLRSLNIRTIVDLRSPEEAAGKKVILDHAANISLPLDFQLKTRERLRPVIYKNHAEEAIAEISNALYLEILDAAVPVFGQVMEILDSSAQIPILVHCQAGKDRTGIISALVMRAMGVPGEFIIKDFMKSNPALSSYFRKRFLIRSVLTLGFFPYSNLLFAVTVKRRNIESVLERVERHYGGIEAYLSASGFDLSKLPGIRQRLLEDTSSGQDGG